MNFIEIFLRRWWWGKMMEGMNQIKTHCKYHNAPPPIQLLSANKKCVFKKLMNEASGKEQWKDRKMDMAARLTRTPRFLINQWMLSTKLGCLWLSVNGIKINEMFCKATSKAKDTFSPFPPPWFTLIALFRLPFPLPSSSSFSLRSAIFIPRPLHRLFSFHHRRSAPANVIQIKLDRILVLTE
jgi:hypothetical protein